MAGLVGIIDNQADTDSLARLLAAMSAAIQHEDWYQTCLHVDKGVALGVVSLNVFCMPQLLFNKDQSLCMAMEGEIYNGQELSRRLTASTGIFGSDLELLLHLYETQGLGFVKNINGSFQLALWDNVHRQFILINDRYGLRPIYYTQLGQRFLFASEVKAILQDPAVKRVVDDEGVADFLTYQIVLGHKTLIKDIQLLPPASILVCQEGQLSLQQYWDFDFCEEDQKLPQDAYIEQLDFLVRQAVERQMQGDRHKGVFLSGGLDSRMLLGAIDRKHFPICTFTQGLPGCNDVRFAEQVAKQAGSEHYFMEFRPDFLSSFSSRGVWLTDGLMSCEHLSRLNILALARQHSQVVLDGLAGDAILGGLYLSKEHFTPDLNRENLTQFIHQRFNSAFSAPMQASLFLDSYLPKVKNAAYGAMKKEVDSAPPLSIANKSEYIYLKNRQRRYIFFGPTLTRSQLECRTPFYDNDLVDFACTIPPKYKLKKHLYLKLLNKMLPNLTQIPWAFSGLPVNSATPFQLFMQRGIYKAQRELRNKVYQMTSGKVILPYRREYKDHSFWLRSHLRNWVEDTLLGQGTDRGYFNQPYIRQLIDEHMNGKQDHRSRLCALITLELWHKLFIDG